MKSAVETLSPTRVKLTVEVPFDELKPALDGAYKRIAAQVTVPGFRKGKVPQRVIDQRVGRAAVLEEAVNEAVNVNLDAAVREHSVRLLSRPEVDNLTFEDNAPLEFTAEADIVPEFELPSYEGLEVTVDAVVIEESDIDLQLDGLRGRFATLLPVERAAASGDMIVFDLAGTFEGEPVRDLVASALSYELGTDGIIPGFDAAVEGAVVGEPKTFDFVPDVGEYVNKTIEVTATVTAVRERELPAADDEFAQLASEFDTIEQLRADLSERVARGKAFEQAYAARQKISEVLMALVDVPLPEGVIASQVAEHFHDNHGDDAHREEVAGQIRDSLKSQLVLDKIADAEQLSVTESELSSWLVQQAPNYGLSPDQFAQQLVDGQQVPMAVSEVRRGKALGHVLEHAHITDSNGAEVDLNSLIGPAFDGVEGDGDLEIDVDDHEGHDHDHDHEGHDHDH